MSSASPFRLARFEYESQHLYFLQKKLFDRLELPKPIYLMGSRGTGKTTLLKALSSSERLNNASLMRQLKNRSARYVGIYLKLPEIQLGLVSGWGSEVRTEVRANVIAHYLDLVWLEELLRTLSELAIRGPLDFSAEDEQKYVSKICLTFASLFAREAFSPSTLRELATALRARRESIESYASTGVPIAKAIEYLDPIYQLGSFGRDVAAFLGELCNSTAATDASPWIFKVCLDEGECLNELQQKVVNTLLRLSRAPLFFVVSFVSTPVDPTTTVFDDLTLGQADRELVLLDEMTPKEFQELVEGVATVRIRHLARDAKLSFSTTKTLGKLDINGLLLAILNESVAPRAKQLLGAAEKWAASHRGSRRRKAPPLETVHESPPIYQTYLIERLELDTSNLSADIPWQRRKQDSAELRKRIVAAYLGICAEVRAEPRYASADVVLQTSDNCVRDFLAQLDEIFQVADLPIERFVNAAIDSDLQDRALKSASQKKYQSLPGFGVNNPHETRALVDALAKLTALLQSKSPTNRHLKSSERGRFSVSMAHAHGDAPESLIRSLREAAEAGFLRFFGSTVEPMSFRVHTSLAPKYGFSYRGAYYEVPLDWRALDRIRRLKNPEELQKMIDSLYQELEKISEQSDLFEERHS